LVIAPDQKQADIVLDYVEANFAGSPILRQLIEWRASRELRLINRIDVEVRAADFRRLRGPTYITVIADEVAFWMSENSANPDAEIAPRRGSPRLGAGVARRDCCPSIRDNPDADAPQHQQSRRAPSRSRSRRTYATPWGRNTQKAAYWNWMRRLAGELHREAPVNAKPARPHGANKCQRYAD
jgi:hypothetical protein